MKVEKIKECANCIHYSEVKGTFGLVYGLSCAKDEHLPGCSFKHFFDTWSEGMKRDAIALIRKGELIPGLQGG